MSLTITPLWAHERPPEKGGEEGERYNRYQIGFPVEHFTGPPRTIDNPNPFAAGLATHILDRYVSVAVGALFDGKGVGFHWGGFFFSVWS